MNKLTSTNKFKTPSKPNNILTIADLIAEKLHIDKPTLRKTIKNKFPDAKTIKLDDDLITKIQHLLTADDSIQKFQTALTNSNKSARVIENFSKLKLELGKLQLAFLIKKINKSNNCEDLLKAFMSALNGKLFVVNEVLANSLINTPNSLTTTETNSTIAKGGGNFTLDLHSENRIDDDINLIDKYYLSYVKYKLKNQELIDLLTTL